MWLRPAPNIHTDPNSWKHMSDHTDPIICESCSEMETFSRKTLFKVLNWKSSIKQGPNPYCLIDTFWEVDRADETGSYHPHHVRWP